MKKGIAVGLAALMLATQPAMLFATDYTSSAFILRDPVVTISGGHATSSNFEYFSSDGQVVTGEHSSASFIGREGFLYFLGVSTPIISTTPGDAKVTINWSAVTEYLGATVSGYQLGYSATSGGPYTYTNVGLVTSAIKTGLTNGTPYYFVVRVLDSDGGAMATSAQATSTPVAAGGGGGGGGGGVGGNTTTGASFNGLAYPSGHVVLLRNALPVASTTADADARFTINYTNITSGNYIFSLYAEDYEQVRSVLLTFPVIISQNYTTNVAGVYVPPTISADKTLIARANGASNNIAAAESLITFHGQTVPTSVVTVKITSNTVSTLTTTADAAGKYSVSYDASLAPNGRYSAAASSVFGLLSSPVGGSVGYTVGPESQLPQGSCGRADMNCDGKVNLVDFSIAAYWYNRQISDAFKPIETERLNNDGKIDLTDFSIMAFYWTG